MRKSTNQRAWWLVAPVLLLVAFNAFIPLMTVVNYSLQETFGDNVFFWEGVTWFEKVLRSERFHDSLLRQLLFTGMIIVRGTWSGRCGTFLRYPTSVCSVIR
jgi:glycerol transport system permease protein